VSATVNRRLVGGVAFALFIATIFAANWAIQTFGLVGVGFGLVAPAGVYFIGLAFTCRDVLQNTWGRVWSLVAILLGAGLSALVAPGFALSSALAALLGELADFAVYTPLLRRGWIRALIPANVAGLVVDSAVFLSLAFGSLRFIEGQIVGKAWMTLLAVLVLYPVRHRYALRPA
jgi:queuosine precursor transporter